MAHELDAIVLELSRVKELQAAEEERIGKRRNTVASPASVPSRKAATNKRTVLECKTEYRPRFRVWP